MTDDCAAKSEASMMNEEEEMQGENSEMHEENSENMEHNANNEEGNSSDNIDERKLFIGGFAPQTKREEFLEYFSKFGEVQSVRLQVDPRSKKSKGYGFVIFKSSEPIEKIIAMDDHMLNNRKITVGKAKLKEGKLFVGGLSANLSKEDIETHFSQYGNVVDVNIPFNKSTNQRRAYCFVTFESERVVRGLARNPKHLLNGQEVDIQVANSDPNDRRDTRHQNDGGYGGGGYERQYSGPPRRPNIPVWDVGYPPANSYNNQNYQNNIPPPNYGQGYGSNRFQQQGQGPRGGGPSNNKWGNSSRNFQRRSRPY